MKIYDLDLDSLDRQEYLSLIKCLCDYYTCLFSYSLTVEEEKC